MKQGWEVKKLGDLCEIKTGRRDANHGNPNGVYHFFTCAKNHSYIDGYSFDTEAILVAGNGDVGAVKYFKGKFDAYQRTYVLKDFESIINVRFLFLLLDGYLKETVTKQKLGNTMPYIKVGMLKSFQVPLPPPPEQQRIVKILDKAFVAIDKAKQNAEQNLRNAKEVFENYLDDVFDNEDFEEIELGEIANFRNGMNYSKSSKGESIKIVGVRDFQNDYWVSFDRLEKVKIDNELQEIDKLKKDDIITVRSNGNPELIGRTLLADNVSGNVSHSGFTIRIRTHSKYITPSYLCHYLKARKTRSKLTKSGKGINIKSLNQVALSKLSVKHPRLLIEQKHIVQKLSELSKKTKKLETLYQQKIAHTEELKKSILQKAFRGEL